MLSPFPLSLEKALVTQGPHSSVLTRNREALPRDWLSGCLLPLSPSKSKSNSNGDRGFLPPTVSCASCFRPHPGRQLEVGLCTPSDGETEACTGNSRSKGSGLFCLLQTVRESSKVTRAATAETTTMF
jgi:hypothetical protein